MKNLMISLLLLASTNSMANDDIDTWVLFDSAAENHLTKANQTINNHGVAVDFNEHFEIKVNQQAHIDLANANTQPLALGIQLTLVETSSY